MTRTSPVLPVVFVALGVAVVLAVYLLLPRAPAPTPEAAPATPPLAARVGMSPADVDSARRFERDEPVADDAPEPPRLPAFAPGERPPEPTVRPEQPPAEPPPPLVLDEAALAAEAAHRALRERAEAEVGAQVREQASALRQACWTPALSGGASSATFAIDASFGADGGLLALGVSDGRGAAGGSAAGVGQCLRRQALELSIEPPGQGVSVAVPLTLP